MSARTTLRLHVVEDQMSRALGALVDIAWIQESEGDVDLDDDYGSASRYSLAAAILHLRNALEGVALLSLHRLDPEATFFLDKKGRKRTYDFRTLIDRIEARSPSLTDAEVSLLRTFWAEMSNVLQHSDSIDLDVDGDAHKCVSVALITHALAMRHLGGDPWEFGHDELESFLTSKHFWPEAEDLLSRMLSEGASSPVSKCASCQRQAWVENEARCASCGAEGTRGVA